MQDEFEKYKLEVAETVQKTVAKIKEEKANRKLVVFSEYALEKLRVELTEIIKKALGISCNFEVDFLPVPAHIKADFTISTFSLAKITGSNPNELAQKIVDYISKNQTDLIESVSAAGAFINIVSNQKELYKNIVSQNIELGEKYGESDTNSGKTVLVDYSAPNIAKPIGVGHLRSTIIGQALANLYHATGYSIVKDNHLGDWGTQFGKLIYAYQKWGDEAKMVEHPINELKDLYVRFHKLAEENPSVEDEARALFARLEQKDPELVALWKRFRDLSLKDFNLVYAQMGIEFDTNIGESFFIDEAEKVVDECLAKGLAREIEESKTVVVDEMGDLPSFLLRKQDGTGLYLTRDLATLQFRIKTFAPDEILYVVGSEQELNFRQMFALAKLAKYLPENVTAKHIGFGMVMVDGKKMSTRRGTLVELADLFEQAIDKSKEILLVKNPGLEQAELERISEIVGIGAILYNDLSQSRTKSISFDWDRMLDFEGGSAVYLQYTCVRINSILNKVRDTFGEIELANLSKNNINFEAQSEFNLAKKLMMFAEIITKAQLSNEPHQICTYLEELALMFNSFYGEVSILKTEDVNLRNSRIALCVGVAQTVKTGLGLLNIGVPEKM